MSIFSILGKEGRSSMPTRVRNTQVKQFSQVDKLLVLDSSFNNLSKIMIDPSTPSQVRRVLVQASISILEAKSMLEVS